MTTEDSQEHAYAVRDPEALARNLARVVEEAGKAASAYLKPREEGKASFDVSDSLGDVIKSLTRVGEYWLADPERTLEAERQLWSGYFDLWSSSMKRMMGEPAKPAAVADPRDKRFADPDWSRNQFFDFIKQVYLITSRWAVDLAEHAAGVDPHTRQKAGFYVKQIANALAPSNFVLTNPELLRETLSSNGENLVRGMHMLAEDIKAGGGDLRIRQTSPGDFFVSGNMLISDARAKQDIEPVGKTFGGTTIYRYRYKAGGPFHFGVMAQEVERTTPDAVVTRPDGLRMVDYAKVT